MPTHSYNYPMHMCRGKVICCVIVIVIVVVDAKIAKSGDLGT